MINKKTLKYILPVIILGLLFIPFIIFFLQKDQHSSPVAPSQETVTTKNKELLQAIQEYDKASSEKRQASLKKLESIAKERETLLLTLMQENPAEAAKVTLTESRDTMPPSVQPHIEKETTINGNLQFVHVDNFSAGKSNAIYEVSTTDNSYVNVTFADQSVKKPEVPGEHMHVALHGAQLQRTLLVPKKTDMQVFSYSAKVLAATAASVTKVAFLPANMKNTTVSQTIINLAKTRMSTVRAFYRDQSFGLASIQGISSVNTADFLPTVTLTDAAPVASNGTVGFDCFAGNNFTIVNGWLDKAKSAAGTAVNNYDLIIVLLPPVCTGSLGAEVSPHLVFFAVKTEIDGIEHEVGHTYNLLHASAYLCTDAAGKKTQIGTNCTQDEYGNPFSILGGASGGHFNAFEKEKAAWFAPNNIRAVTQSGTYTLAPIEQNTSAVQAIKIPTGKTDANGNPQYYYLEYRQPLGFDAHANAFNHGNPSNLQYNVFKGILINIAPTSCTGLCDVTLINAAPQQTDLTKAAFETGSTFTDPQAKLSVKVTSVTSSQATLSITYAGTPPSTTPSTGPIPTFVCGGSQNCVPSSSPSPTMGAIASPTGLQGSIQPSTTGGSNPSSPVASTQPSNAQPSTGVTGTPCGATSSVTAEHKKHKHHRKGTISKLMEQLIKLLEQLLQLLQQLAGGNTGNGSGGGSNGGGNNGGSQNPCTSPTP